MWKRDKKDFAREMGKLKRLKDQLAFMEQDYLTEYQVRGRAGRGIGQPLLSKQVSTGDHDSNGVIKSGWWQSHPEKASLSLSSEIPPLKATPLGQKSYFVLVLKKKNSPFPTDTEHFLSARHLLDPEAPKTNEMWSPRSRSLGSRMGGRLYAHRGGRVQEGAG